MFFDGAYASKRKVALGGSSKKDQDKQAFLDKQKNEREKRQHDKQKLKSAICIQAFYRGRIGIAKIKQQERIKWDQDIKSTGNANTIFVLVRTLLFFYNAHTDYDRLRTLCDVILDNIVKAPAQSYLGLCTKQDSRKQWLRQAKSLLKICQTKLSSSDSSYSKMLKIFTNLSVFESLVGKDEAKRLVISILDFLIENGLFNNIREAMLSINKKVEEKISILLLSLQRFNPDLSSTTDKTIASLLNTIFSCADIVAILKRKELEKDKNNFLSAMLRAPELSDHLELKSTDANIVLACTLLGLSNTIFDMSPDLLQNYIKILNTLLSALPKSVKKSVSEDDMEIEVTSPVSPHMFRLYDTLTHFSTPETLKRMFQTFLPPPSQVPSIPTSTPSSPLPFSSLASPGLSSLSRFVDLITSPTLFPAEITSTSHANSIINSVSLGSSFVRTMWAVLSNSKEFSDLVAKGASSSSSILSSSSSSISSPFGSSPTFASPFGSSAFSSFPSSSSSPSPFSSFSSSSSSSSSSFGAPSIASSLSSLSSSEFEATVAMWARSYSQVLMTLDDGEFFEQQAYFRLPEIRHMASVLNRLVFRTYWGSTTGATAGTSRFGNLPKDESGLRTVLTTLVRQLYDRDTRRSYCPEGHWIIDVSATRDGAQLDPTNEKISTVLRNIPFVIPFNERVKIFHQYIEQDKETIRHNFYNEPRVSVRRNFIFEDGLKVFSALGNAEDKLRERIRVEFVNSEGLVEAGVDGGGLFKDFITDLVKTAFDPQYALFLPTQDLKLYPNPSSSFLSSEHIEQFEFLGRILGKAMYESILVELPLANFFLAKILGKYNLVNDLVFLDPQLHKNLMSLKTYAGNIEDLALNFTVVDNEFGQAQVRDLVPNGKDIAVTNENKIRYIYLVAHHRLNVQIKQQCDGFLKGFSELIKPEWVRMFNQDELQFLISGSPGGVDIRDFRDNTVYSGGYNATHPTITMFWQVVSEMSPSDQRDLLKFVTSCSRPPLLGFGYLYPRFCIHVSRGEAEDIDQYLPSASTCMNLLKLPPYSNKQSLRDKLLYAISSNAGFDLS